MKFNILIALCIVFIFLTSCNFTTRQKIESGLKEPLSVYPTKNLEDFYDKEGYRDSNFSKDDKGVWSVYTSISRRNNEGLLRIEGVMLYIDRNTRKSEGYYFDKNDSNNEMKKFNRKYAVTMKNNRLILKDKNVEKRIKNKVQNFKFLVQYGNFKNLNQYETDNVIYNSQAPNYLISYTPKVNDKNLNQIQKLYHVQVGGNVRLQIYGNSELKNIAQGSNKIQFLLEDQVDRYINSTVIFKSKGSLNNEHYKSY